VRPPITPSNMN